MDSPHRRYNPLTGQWVLVSPHRNQRPWSGQQEAPAETPPNYVSDCYLCPGNERVGGIRNPDYKGVYVFDNDFPALLPAPAPAANNTHPLLLSQPVAGRCRVICYSPRHDLTMAKLSVAEIIEVIATWAQEVSSLSETYEWVQIFENRGTAMGCSNLHPHGQIWATDFLPSEAAVVDGHQRAYWQANQRALLADYRDHEATQGVRVVIDNADWLVVVPYWAVWPFETLVLPKRSAAHLNHLDEKAQRGLSETLQQLLRCYDQLFDTPFPYSMGWHGSPRAREDLCWLVHAHFYPPLLRSSSVRKHMVGFEMLGESQRDLTPEVAAETLSALAAKQ